MPSLAQISVHPSQFPENVRRDLIESLRLRKINHKFHYDSVKQAHRWLALHNAYSPFVTDVDCAAVYDRAFEAVSEKLPPCAAHIIGLGCGGGQKDVRLLRLLAKCGRETFYTPADVSSAMVLIARQAALEVIKEQNCFPLVLDLATTDDLPSTFQRLSVKNATRLVTFFGMLPNFEPKFLLTALGALIQRGDHLLLGANLAPGLDYGAGVKRILPLYDNDLTREWLITFLMDLGVTREDGRMKFVIEDDETGLKRITAYFDFERRRDIQTESEHFAFNPDDSIRLFFSYRHTPKLIHSLFTPLGLEIVDQWVNPSEEEGVFLLRRSADIPVEQQCAI
jgi:L-histidine N-alpha-methyltransferase